MHEPFIHLEEEARPHAIHEGRRFWYRVSVAVTVVAAVVGGGWQIKTHVFDLARSAFSAPGQVAGAVQERYAEVEDDIAPFTERMETATQTAVEISDAVTPAIENEMIKADAAAAVVEQTKLQIEQTYGEETTEEVEPAQ